MSSTGRDVARRALERIERDGDFASAALDRELARADLEPRERALATELTYGVLRYRSRLDRALAAYARRGLGRTRLDVLTVLRVAAYQLIFLDRVPQHAAVNDAAMAVQRRGKAVAGFVNGLLRTLAREGEPAIADGEPRAICMQRHAMPAELVAALGAALAGDELAAACAGFCERPPLWLRPNPLVTTPESLRAALAEEGVAVEMHESGALRAQAMGSPDRTASFARGAYTVQDLAAQWVGLLAAPAPGQRILDACAGVGGKTTHLAELAMGKATIHAADKSAKKLEQLRASATRLGLASAIEPMVVDLVASDDGLADSYDTIVIDAPCTGIGVLRRHPELKWREGSVDSRELESVQWALLSRLAPRVRSGGSLTYAVCSFKVEEGPAQIERFLAEHSEFAVDASSTRVPVARDPNGFLRTWPHRDDADAFFAVRLVRS